MVGRTWRTGAAMDTGAIVLVTVQDRIGGRHGAATVDAETKASEQVEAVQPDGATRRWLPWTSLRSAAILRRRPGTGN